MSTRSSLRSPTTVSAAILRAPPSPSSAPKRTDAIYGERSVPITPLHGVDTALVRVRYALFGNPDGPLLVVLGGISASRQIVSDGERRGWWDVQVGTGMAIDLRRFRVLGIDWLDRDDLAAANAVSSADQADAIAALIDVLGLGNIAAAIGSSYGAMVALTLAARHRERVRRVIAISGAHRAHPMAIAVRSIQRDIVRLGLRQGDADGALALARALAMTTYRSEDEFAQRFSRVPEWRDGCPHFAVHDYLDACGQRYLNCCTPSRFLALSESIDLHAVDPRELTTPVTIIGIDSDRLVPIADLRELAAGITAPCTLHEIDSIYGHDAFLKEPERIGALLRDALQLCCGDLSS